MIFVSFVICDLCDVNEDKLSVGMLYVLLFIFVFFGCKQVFVGLVCMFKVFEDNVLVCKVLEILGNGDVLVVDGGGSLCCVLVGGNLVQLVQDNGWVGILVNGCVCDVVEFNVCEVGIWVFVIYLQCSFCKGVGDVDIKVGIVGVVVYLGDWIYVDVDGVLVLCIWF